MIPKLKLNKLVYPLLLFVGCQKHPQNESTFDAGYFKLTFYESTRFELIDSTASNIKYYFPDTQDTLYVDIGIETWNFSEQEPHVMYIPPGVSMDNIDTSGYLIDRGNSFDLDLYRHQNVRYLKLNNYNTKITEPRFPGIGVTGLRIDSICRGRDLDVIGALSISIYGFNLDPKFESNLIASFSTIDLNMSHFNCIEK